MTKNKAVMLIAAGIALASPVAMTAAPELSETRSTLKEWVELKKLISDESSRWAVEEETLTESIQLLEREIENLKETIDKQEAEASDAEKARVTLTAEEDALKQASSVVKAAIKELEETTVDIVRYLPLTLQKKVAILTGRIPKTRQAEDATSLSVRVMNVIGILTEIEKFNSMISVDQEVQDINGTNIKVDTIYIGLAVAYYVDGTKTEAGYMIPAKDGWKKVQDNSLADSVAAAVAMQKREQTASFVNLPITVTDVK